MNPPRRESHVPGGGVASGVALTCILLLSSVPATRVELFKRRHLSDHHQKRSIFSLSALYIHLYFLLRGTTCVRFYRLTTRPGSPIRQTRLRPARAGAIAKDFKTSVARYSNNSAVGVMDDARRGD